MTPSIFQDSAVNIFEYYFMLIMRQLATVL